MKACKTTFENATQTDSLLKTKQKNGLKLPLIGKNGYKNIFSKSNEDLRNQSVTENEDLIKKYDEIKESPNSPPGSPTSDSWYKTWPERGEKNSPEHVKKSPLLNDPSGIDRNGFKNKLTLNEALQSIPLAYSPVTKQLHLVDNHNRELSCKKEKNDVSGGDLEMGKKMGHRRTEAGSFSSTISAISAISEPSTSGSLLDSDERSLTSFEDCEAKPRKKSISNFFTRNVTSNVWKLFTTKNNEESNSPIHVVASSSALIPHKRPSNLPAKTEEEEQRHMEEYNAILVAAKKKEAKSNAERQKHQKQQLQMEEQQAAAARHFINHVLPKWDVMQKHKKTQELWWNGLPSSVRGKVWRLAIGNELNISSQLYEICSGRAQSRLNDPQHPKNDEESSMDAIELDISRTFPNLCIFQQGGPYSDVLHTLLAAYVCFRPDVGYVQGMSFIAAILILNMDACDAFICFANLLNRPLHLAAFTLDQIQMAAYYSAYNEVFCHNLPKLFAHFDTAGLTPDLYLLDWIYTIFAKAMPLDIACRVWDIFLRDGYEFVFRTALGILHLYQNTLISMDFLHGAQFLTRLPEEMSSHQLFKSIQSVTTCIGRQSFSQIVEKNSENNAFS